MNILNSRKRKEKPADNIRNEYSASNGPKISDIIEGANIDKNLIEKRTKYIKSHLDEMTEDQLTRFEFFVRSHFPKKKIKEIISAKLASSNSKETTDEMAIVVGSLAKLFCGELIDGAIKVQLEKDIESDGGIAPSDIAEAVRRMQRDGKFSTNENSSYMFGKGNIFGDSQLDEDIVPIELLE